MTTPAAPPPPPADDRRPRRGFLAGAVSGAVGGVVAGAAAVSLTTPRPPAPDRPTGAESFAQCGEDLIALSLLGQGNVTGPVSYLDIGAADPVRGSNTYLFYAAGGRGVLVEPNPRLADRIREARPRDTLLPVGVGVGGQAAADYYVMSNSDWNTFDKDEAERRVREGNGTAIRQVLKVPLVDVNAVIADHFGGTAPDFLSIDIEGLDLAVLKTLDWDRFRPKVLCVETLVALSNRMDPATTAFLATKDYAARAMTFPNTLYVDSRWFR